MKSLLSSESLTVKWAMRSRTDFSNIANYEAVELKFVSMHQWLPKSLKVATHPSERGRFSKPFLGFVKKINLVEFCIKTNEMIRKKNFGQLLRLFIFWSSSPYLLSLSPSLKNFATHTHSNTHTNSLFLTLSLSHSHSHTSFFFWVLIVSQSLQMRCFVLSQMTSSRTSNRQKKFGNTDFW